MHLVLAVLGVVVTILVLLNRLQQGGLDLGWLNPFSWQRRRKFRIEHDQNPVFTLESPMEVAALFMVAVAKVDGEISAEQKHEILKLFRSEFHLTDKQATELLGSSVHLFGRGDEVLSNPENVIKRALDNFSFDQTESVAMLVNKVGQIEGNTSDAQYQLIQKIESILPRQEKSTW